MDSSDDYYERASGWAVARQAGADRSRRVAWTVAIVALGVVVLQAVGLILLTPLKTVEPVTLLVDRQTGYVQALKPLSPERISADSALTQSFLVQYVIAREEFDRAILKQDYRKVALWSTGRARGLYLASIPASNPDSPLNRYPAGTSVEVRVKSVSPIGTNMAQVRFDTRASGGAGGAAPPRDWVAIIRYRYSDAPMSLADRFINPLGFQVIDYRRNAEALPRYSDPDMGSTPRATTTALTATPVALASPRSVAIIMPAEQVPLGSPLGPLRR